MKRDSLILIAVLIITLFAVYWRTFHFELIWDSKLYLKQNPLFTENYPLSSAFKQSFLREPLGTNMLGHYYRPLLVLSFMIENKLWGLKNTSLGLINLIIYIFSLIFLYFFLKEQSEKKYFAEIATLLFAFYPINTENIVWAVGRSDLLVLFWGTLTFLFLEFFIKKGQYYFLILSSFFYLLGIFSKESLLFFLPVLIIYELIKRKKISIPYHLANVLFSILFFVLKNAILEIKNLRIIFSSHFTENIKAGLGSLGYYFRSMIFPFDYDMFLPQKDVINFKYYIFGILFILLFAYLLYRSKKDQEVIIPLSFILFFILGHIVLVYTILFPFKIYARYMMIPALGFIWIFAKYIGALKERIRLSLIFILLLILIPSTIINSYSFKNELTFFQRANRSSPKDGYILFQVAKALQEKENYLGAELALNKALFSEKQKETAMLIYLLYTEIEFRKSDYKNVLKWLASIESFARPPYVELAPLMRFFIDYKKALVYIYQGKTGLAETILKENIEKYKNKKDLYQELYNLYIGHNLWEKAEDLEKTMKERFPSFKNLNTSQIKREFELLSPKERMGFYIRYRNFDQARKIVQTLSPMNLDLKILLARLYYWEDREEEGKKIIHEILLEYQDDPQVINTLGNFYLKDLIRIKEALFYFEKSLEINKDQPEVSKLVSYLKNYLNELKDY